MNKTLAAKVKMSIVTAKAPIGGLAGSVAAMLTASPQPLSAPGEGSSDPGGNSGPNFDLAAPHQIFAVGLDDVAKGRLLEAAQPQAWRYIVLQGTDPVATATFHSPDVKEAIHVTRGPYVISTVQALHVAETAPEIATGDFEPRLLDVSALHLRALWLHADKADFLIPLVPAPAGVQAYRLYSEGDLLKAIQPLTSKWDEAPMHAGG